jgi:hypothetical protein
VDPREYSYARTATTRHTTMTDTPTNTRIAVPADTTCTYTHAASIGTSAARTRSQCAFTQPRVGVPVAPALHHHAHTTSTDAPPTITATSNEVNTDALIACDITMSNQPITNSAALLSMSPNDLYHFVRQPAAVCAHGSTRTGEC